MNQDNKQFGNYSYLAHKNYQSYYSRDQQEFNIYGSSFKQQDNYKDKKQKQKYKMNKYKYKDIKQFENQKCSYKYSKYDNMQYNQNYDYSKKSLYKNKYFDPSNDKSNYKYSYSYTIQDDQQPFKQTLLNSQDMSQEKQQNHREIVDKSKSSSAQQQDEDQAQIQKSDNQSIIAEDNDQKEIIDNLNIESINLNSLQQENVNDQSNNKIANEQINNFLFNQEDICNILYDLEEQTTTGGDISILSENNQNFNIDTQSSNSIILKLKINSSKGDINIVFRDKDDIQLLAQNIYAQAGFQNTEMLDSLQIYLEKHQNEYTQEQQQKSLLNYQFSKPFYPTNKTNSLTPSLQYSQSTNQ